MLKRKNRIYIAPFAAVCMLILSACSTDDVPSVPNLQDKTPIELTVGVVGENPSPMTRAVVTTDNPFGYSASAFGSGTSIYMVMKSEKDDADATYTRTIGYAQEQQNATNTLVKFASAYGRFWEDAHSRNSQLSVYAACVPGYYLPASAYEGITPNGTADSTTPWTVGSSAVYSNDWNASYSSTTIAWPLRTATATHQDNAFVSSQDLCFSNNVSNIDVDPSDEEDPADNRVTFNESLKKFGSGRLVFYHALTKVTFRIKKGEGFLTGDPFAFSNTNENIVLKGFNTSGTFDIIDGEFKTSDPAIGTGDITELASRGASGDYAYVLDCLMLPGTNLNSTAANQIYFTIDNNLYHLTKKDLMNALAGKKLSDAAPTAEPAVPGTDALTEDHKMRPGVHYIFTLTVGKKKMDNFTAAVVRWEEVEADETTPSNARIVVSLLDNGEKLSGADAVFDLYRKADVAETIPAKENAFASFAWTTGYAPSAAPTSNKAKLTETTTGVYSAENADADPKVDEGDPDTFTPWYWPDNKTFYHFRTVMPKNHEVTEDATNGDYISLTGESIALDAAYYTGVCWGAPFKDTESKLTYSTTSGFDNTQDPGTAEDHHQISKAIGPTENNIKMELFHMMSDVTIQLTTSSGTDAVTLAGATVKLSNIYNSGLVRMGTGKVETTGAVSSPEIGGTVTLDDSKYKWRYAFVPQALTNVVLSIQTADDNLYFVDMKDVVASSVGNNLIANPYDTDEHGKYIINYWYPNYRYTYTFKLTKSDISLITATLANWENVIAGDDNVQIK